MRVRRTLVGLGLAVVLLAGASGISAAQERSLYERIGGYNAIAAVVDEFLARGLADPKIGRLFVGVSTDSKGRLRQHIVDQLCMLAGGPRVYTGRSMQQSHAGT